MAEDKRRALAAKIKKVARDVGFDLAGIAPAEPPPEAAVLRGWVDRGYAGEMRYITSNVARRSDVRRILPSARSVIACGLAYETDAPKSIDHSDPTRGWISRYAWGDDYHLVMEEMLARLWERVKALVDGNAEARIYVDTGPVLERAYAAAAGLGAFGKNACLLNKRVGSLFFIGVLVTSIELDFDRPVRDLCGTCTACIKACPTGAFPEPYLLDATRCISYLTIELKDEIPKDRREWLGRHVFGCDVCQDVCPWNRKAPKTKEGRFEARGGAVNPSLEDLAELSVEEFKQRFSRSSVKRAKRRGLLRNVMVAIGNAGDPALVPAARRGLRDDDPLVRGHAAWALERLENGP